MAQALAIVRLVKITSDDDRIAVRQLGFRSGHRVDEGNFSCIRRPSNVVARGWQRTIGTLDTRQKFSTGSVRVRDYQTGLLPVMSTKGNPPAVWRPDGP